MTIRIPSLLILILLLACGCRRTAAAPQPSPDGTMMLTTSVNLSKADPTCYRCVIVDITDAAGKRLYREVTPASDVQRWSIRWVNNDEVLLSSSDVGNYHIQQQPDGSWKGKLGAH